MTKKYKNCLIIGSNKISRELISYRIELEDSYDVIVLKKEFKFENVYNVHFHSGLESLENLLSTKKIQSIFYCFEFFNKEELLFISKICKKNNLIFFISSNIDSISNKHFVDLRNIEDLFIKERFYRKFLLRILDIFFSLIVLIVFLPIFLIISLLIFLEDGLPVFFIHKRVGLNNKNFSIYKFRSMHKNSKKYGLSPLEDDDNRITKIGKFIRATSLDELPQFFNVLKGDKAIVGPRPEMKFIVDNYNSFEKFRLKIKPGITGAWQVSHTRNAPIHYNVDYDLYQIINNSLRYNITQIIKTLLWATKGF